MKEFVIVLSLFTLLACSKDFDDAQELSNDWGMYFPSLVSDDWKNTSPESLDWNSSAINELYSFLSENDTRAFILLKDGKIVLEQYWGNTILNTSKFQKESLWYWASAGKTLTAFLVGLAQEDGFLDVNDKTSDYLGQNWSDLPSDKEDLILIKHQLTMTTGLDYRVANSDCTTPSCLQYKVDAGEQWYYHNAPYTLLENVLSSATGTAYNTFTDEKVEQKIGMDGRWIKSGDNNVYWSTARDAARFGLLLLNKGTWNKQQVMADTTYFNAMINSSQNINPSYGYLCWLNGKTSIIFPGLPIAFNVPLSENASSDLYAAIGKNGQFIEVVPSQNIVLVRMGEAPDNAQLPISFHNEMWERINALID